MKRIGILWAIIALCIAGSVSAYNPYAPNPFDTMEKTTWEYQYLQELTQDGLTQSDMSKFSPQYSLTRFEMAQMVAAAMQNRSRATAAQQEKIDKLAAAFADDLSHAGVSPAQPAVTGGQVLHWNKEK